MKTTFGQLSEGSLFLNEFGQVVEKGCGILAESGKIISCPEGDIGRFYCLSDEPVTQLNSAIEVIG